MRLIAILLLTLYSFGPASKVAAQSYQIQYRGYPIWCTAYGGVPVRIWTDAQSGAMAQQHGGGFAMAQTPTSEPVILLDLTTLNGIPVRSAFMLIYHECAHLALPIGVGVGSSVSERNADCHAILSMRSAGLVRNWQEFGEAVAYASSLPHGISSGRISAMQQCLIQSGF